jgi:hypothetical protein
MKVHLFCTIFILVSSSVFSEEVINGVVRDSVLNLPIPFVKVKISNPPCSVYTDQDGRFSLSIPISVSVLKPAQPGHFIRVDLSNTEIKAFDLRGVLLSDRQGSGARVFTAGKYNVCKTAVFMSGRRHTVLMSMEDLGGPMKIAQSASSRVVVFLKDGYNPLQRSLFPGQETEVKLTPLSVSANIKVSVDSVSTVILKTDFNEENEE